MLDPIVYFLLLLSCPQVSWHPDQNDTEIELRIAQQYYPDNGSVIFYSNGRRDRTDVRGPEVGDRWHTSDRNDRFGDTLSEGDVYAAKWISNSITYVCYYLYEDS